ncbi:MAG: TonB-dependent receptor [Gemmatimonadales bacterium]|nr:MAG: TonB-dependent receptor [Gemmatimonadales bacterium]
MRPHSVVRVGLVAALGALFALVAPPLQAQTGQITGRVISGNTGAPLVGVQITLEGTDIGTITNAQGRYLLLNAPVGAQTLQAMRLGYATVTMEVTVTAGGPTVVDFRMSEEAIALEEVVVTGTAGSARRKELGNAIGVISEDDIAAIPAISATDVLQGQTAGLTIRNTGGALGQGSEIMLRGVNTLGGPNANRPLIYVDGVRISGSSHAISSGETGAQTTVFDDLDAANIERIEVIKGAAATTLYGTEAAAGVIQVFTKGGGGGQPQWTANISQGFSDLGHIGPEEDPTGLHLNDCTMDPGCPASGTWLKTGHLQQYDLSVRGGQQNPWYVGGSFSDNTGNVGNQASRDFSVRGNFRFSPLDNLSVRTSNMFTRRNITFVPDGNNAEGLLLNVMRWTRDYTNNEDGLTLDMDLRQQIDHFITGAQIIWTPSPDLSQRVNVGLDYISSEHIEERPWGFFYVPEGNRETNLMNDRNITLDYAGTYTRDLDLGFLGLSTNTSWGAQYYDSFRWGTFGIGEIFAGPGDKVLQSGVNTDATETWLRVASGGFFVQEQLGWNDRLFVTLGGRWDGFSTFGENFGLAFYPKISAAYTISDHDFWPGFWETMKLRGAIGQSGRAPGPFASKRTWASTSGDDQQPAVILAELGNPDVGPERTEEKEFGFEGSMFNGRFSFDLTYYDQSTFDALLRLPRPASIGTEQALLTNLGEVENKGVEFTANVNVYNAENVSWSVGGNFFNGENKIVSLGPVTDERLQGRPVDAQFGDVVQNRDELGVRPVFEEEYLGPARPTTTWGLNTKITLFQRLTIDALGEFQGGHVRQAGTARQNVRRSYWVPCEDVINAVDAGDISGFTAAELGKCSQRDASYGEWTVPGDFFRLRHVTLSYRMPENWLPPTATGMTLRASGRNLWTSTDYPGIDPEGNAYGTDAGWYWSTREYYNLPIPRVFSFSATVTF